MRGAVTKRVAAANELAGRPFHKLKSAAFHRDPGYFIAHAGGAIDGSTYTNSREAIELAIKNGFKFIETDLITTTDGHLFAAHDWKFFNETLTGRPDLGEQPASLAEAKSRKILGKYTPVDMADLREIFAENDSIHLVTDKTADYRRLVDSFPFADRLIVEVFTVDQYLKALEAGIRYPAFAIFGPADLEAALTYKFNQVTAPSQFVEENRADFARLHSLGVAVMTYGGPDTEEYFAEALGRTTSLYYSDFWSPRTGGPVK